MTNYDVVVIGAGQGGDPLARAFAQSGKKTALIERDQIGGTCVNVGCTPTKTMAASARVAYLARRASEYGVHTGPVSVDMMAVRRRKQSIVEDFRSGTERKISQIGDLTLIRGAARFTGPKTLTVKGDETETLTARQIVINTGARSSVPKIDGLETVAFLDYASIEEMDTVPERLLILGGGYIALEFGQMFRRFGSDVAIIQQGKHLLDREDEDIAEAMASILREDGIQIYLNATAKSVENSPQHGVILTVETPDGTETLAGSHLLVATGRMPNTDALGLTLAGVECDEHGFVKSNDRLETSAPDVYVIGDVKGGPAFTHISYDDFRVLKANLIDGGAASIAGRPVPYTVFTDPQLGRVGLSETEARAQGKSIQVATLPMSEAARAIEIGETRGFMKAVIDTETKQILGAAILGVEGGEVMAVLQVAMLGKLPYTALRDGVFAHPTLAESLNNLFMTLD